LKFLSVTAEQVDEPADDLKEGIRQAIGFLMHNQLRAEDAYLLRDAQLAAGGVIWNYLDPTIRIDSVQHACSVILLGAEYLSGSPGHRGLFQDHPFGDHGFHVVWLD
jgi:hypothetical protein